ncbi:Flagellar motor rotation protein MotB [hydrothermal vent metagenome]|uniref:Flagellar motor rotation protein MotB n=1 Tax=hydrothermal vent metagenome TaxID=652676 RepID=A0A3B1DDB3_9ZZZZ
MAEEEKKKEPDPAEEEDDEEECECEEGIPAWVMTFADLVTLLMVFFILLFAMGSIEDEKWRLVKESLKSALGSDVIPESGTRQGLEVITSALSEESFEAVDEIGAMVAKEIEEIASEVEEFVYKNKLAGQVQVSSDERGAVITVSDIVLFSPGTATMNAKGAEVISQVFDLLNQFNYKVKIEGHTDDSPIRTERFPSNWELSASRAAEVARMFVESGFSAENLSIEGLAQFRPKVPNTSPTNRAINRRIEIVYQRGSIRKQMVDIIRRGG